MSSGLCWNICPSTELAQTAVRLLKTTKASKAVSAARNDRRNEIALPASEIPAAS